MSVGIRVLLEACKAKASTQTTRELYIAPELFSMLLGAVRDGLHDPQVWVTYDLDGPVYVYAYGVRVYFQAPQRAGR